MTAIRQFIRTFFRIYDLIWVQAGILAVFFLVIDFACRLVSPLTYGTNTSDLEVINAYPEIPWLGDYYKAYNAMSGRWHPYSNWIANPVKSPYINIDDGGLRATWNVPRMRASQTSKAIRLFVFGGSTTFGDNARDDYTIPSILAKHLATDVLVPVEVTNFGQEGYCGSQETLLLEEQLRKGNIPDLVIFYDGANDVCTAFENHQPGLTYDEISMRREFRLLNQENRLKLCALAAYSFLRYSACGRTVEWFVDKVAHQWWAGVQARRFNSRLKETGISKDVAEPLTGQLEDGVVHTYLFNKHAVQMMALQFGFRCLYFWQPILFTKPKPSPTERSLVSGDLQDFPQLSRFFIETYRKLHKVGASEHVIDISDTFANSEKSYYTDWAHVTEAGNELVVRKMLPHVKALLADQKWVSSREKPAERP